MSPQVRTLQGLHREDPEEDLFRLTRLGTALVLLLAAFFGPAPSPGQNAGSADRAPLFQTSDRCIACHNGLTTPSGQDISIGFDWRPSLMANASRDPYWQAGVRRETLDHPESRAAIEDECSICHMPMAHFLASVAGRQGEVFAHLPFDLKRDSDRYAADGVSCSLCHQIAKDKLGTRESFVGGFVVETKQPKGERAEYGPYKVDAGHARIMRSSTGGFQPTESAHIRKSELCATCHTLYTKALGPQGKVIGELPEQVPYLEWLHSGFRENQSCQSCHMPVVREAVPVTPVFGEPREGFSRHVFVGGNFFIQRLLNRFRADLGVESLPQELESAADRTINFLKTSAAAISIDSVELRSDRLEVVITAQNLGGHKFPTAYPSRRVWLHVTMRDGNNRIFFESGALEPGGMIKGNDNDDDATRYEPHHREITRPSEVQIYEAIMADASGAVTTGLLHAVKYVKDNRLLPRGFDKQTADKDIAVVGDAVQDPDFGDEGDTIRYSAGTAGARGPFQIQAELWYQPISYRWAQNLRPYSASEPRRFVGYYEALSSSSGIMLVRATAGK
jgi:hypothetical protein